MPRSFDVSADYEGSIDGIYRAFTDADYWLGRLEFSSVDESKLESMRVGGESGDDGTIDVVTLQVMHRHNLPSVVTQVHRGDLCVRREEIWSPLVDGTMTASIRGSILNAPVSVAGTAVISPLAASGGAKLDVSDNRPGPYPADRRQTGETHRRSVGHIVVRGTTLHHDVARQPRRPRKRLT